MSYATIYDANNKNIAYEIRRKAVIESIFADNFTLISNLYPFEYEHDIHDQLVDEVYCLVLGGDTARKEATDMLEQLSVMHDEYEEEPDILAMIEGLISDYQTYVTHFIEQEEV